MKFINKILIVMIVIFTCFTGLKTPVFSSLTTTQNIRIGLYFGSTALSQAKIKASDLTVLDENNFFLGTVFGDGSYTVAPVNQGIVAFSETYPDLNTALVEIATSKGFFDNSFVYISSDGYRIATYSDKANTIFDPKIGGNIGLFSSSNKPIIVYDSSIKLRFSNSYLQEYIEVQNKPYRGSISFLPDSSNKLTVINTLLIEEYIYGVVAKEMPATWNKEALKAQAVAARNYAVKNLNKYKSLGFDLSTTQNSQVYGGVAGEHINTTKAVDETRGILAYYNGDIADLFYHSSSGGKTENSENVWSNSVPYLRGVEDSFSLGSPNDYWEYKISKADVEKLLKNKSKNIGKLSGIRIDKVSENGRVLKLTFVGDKGETSIEKESIRAFFGYSNLKSTWFTINSQTAKINDSYNSALDDLQLFLNTNNYGSSATITSQEYVFQGKGYGHGLGMSQYGAKKMADSGYSFDQILKYYFRGIDVY